MIMIRLNGDLEQMCVMEGLHALLGRKDEAYKVVSDEFGGVFSENDFGIPQIKLLIERLETVFYGPKNEPAEEVK
jgi:hypothetical protein